ncbi:MAG: hypothetical protein AAB489_05720 [Patescibacteria group bacterium]
MNTPNTPDEITATNRPASTLLLTSEDPKIPDIEIMLWPGWLEELKQPKKEQAA